ncbi:hypothetical protein A0U40_14835 [[Bacillus] sp. KCTC 13219]|nr:hypothetical protein A0U40_14835 [[Bacillus] sp. KCTC 13219]
MEKRERQFGQLLAIANVLIGKIHKGNGPAVIDKYWERYRRNPADTFVKMHAEIIEYIYLLNSTDIALLDLFQSILADMDIDDFNNIKLADNYIHAYHEQKDSLNHLIGVNEASEMWGLTAAYIKNLCAEGRVDAIKIGNTWVIDKRQPNPRQK